MDKIVRYEKYIKEILQDHAPVLHEGYDEFEAQVVVDTENKHYYLMRMGWNGLKREHYCVIHIDIKPSGKIWIQQDWTEYGVARELEEKGVPKSEIVLAFQAPYMRPHTEYAIA